MKLIMEIRAAEGGRHAELLVKQQANIYEKYCQRNNIKFSILENVPGFISI
ncbi:MAG TPA: PCRF domain-containing protein [Waddliaceae bacterium]